MYLLFQIVPLLNNCFCYVKNNWIFALNGEKIKLIFKEKIFRFTIFTVFLTVFTVSPVKHFDRFTVYRFDKNKPAPTLTHTLWEQRDVVIPSAANKDVPLQWIITESKKGDRTYSGLLVPSEWISSAAPTTGLEENK